MSDQLVRMGLRSLQCEGGGVYCGRNCDQEVTHRSGRWKKQLKSIREEMHTKDI